MHGSKLFVKYIDQSVTLDDITALFQPYGDIRDVKLLGDRGIAFVEMERQMDAEKAMKELNRLEFRGKTLQVKEAVAKKGKRR